MTDAVYANDDRIIPETHRVSINISEDGQSVSLSYPSDEIKEAILQSTVLEEPVEEVEEIQGEVEDAATEAQTQLDRDIQAKTPLEDVPETPVSEVFEAESDDAPSPAEEPSAPTLFQDTAWLNISIEDPTLKFAVRFQPLQLF